MDERRVLASADGLATPLEELVRQVCGIRFTPDRRSLPSNRSHYDWIRRGFVLYRALERADFAVVECFPTASWTVWAGPRGAKSRAAWAASALTGLALDAVPARLGPDGRDAIAAAVTARLHDSGRSSFAEIVVPGRASL